MKRHILWLEILNIIKICVFPKLIFRINEILKKIPAVFLVKIDELSLKFYMKDQTPKNRKDILEEK